MADPQIGEWCLRRVRRADAVDHSEKIAIGQLREDIIPVLVDPVARLGYHCSGTHAVHQRNYLAHPVIAMQ
jgi:hypothetical protein